MSSGLIAVVVNGLNSCCPCFSALTKILPKAMQLVNVTKSDGFTALHIAAINGYKLTVAALIEVVSS